MHGSWVFSNPVTHVAHVYCIKCSKRAFRKHTWTFLKLCMLPARHVLFCVCCVAHICYMLLIFAGCCSCFTMCFSLYSSSVVRVCYIHTLFELIMCCLYLLCADHCLCCSCLLCIVHCFLVVQYVSRCSLCVAHAYYALFAACYVLLILVVQYVSHCLLCLSHACYACYVLLMFVQC